MIWRAIQIACAVWVLKELLHASIISNRTRINYEAWQRKRREEGWID